MPEGDTIHKLAVFLDGELRGRVIDGVWLHPALGPSRQGPFTVSAVSCKGKHLYLDFGDGSTLRSHLGLYGAWHRYRPGEPWHKPARRASIRIDGEPWVYVCFNAREAEWLRSAGLRAADSRARLGPDLIQSAPDPAHWLQRTLALVGPDTPLVDLLLDQRIAAGIGNVYKSEVLFLAGQPPTARLRDLDAAGLTGLYQQAADLLRANLGGGPRRTRPGGLWVYGRQGRLCLRCATPIRRDELGTPSRSTYWCPDCQRS